MDKKTKYTIIIFIAAILVSNGLLYYVLSSALNKKYGMLSAELQGTKQSLTDAIMAERLYTDTQYSNLENKTMTNFQNLQSFISKETTKLKLDLGGVVAKVGGLEQKSSELEGRIASIGVTSQDFSSIIEDVVRAVVSVKTDQGQASGFIFDKQGYVMTNKHVIAGASRISVVDYSGKAYPVLYLGAARDADLAVLKINANETFYYLGFASTPRVGTRVIAVGNPLGLSFTVTEGIVSAVDRVIDDTGIGYIQTDVSINPGNSGGPLIDAESNVVGINTFKITDTEGLGFAIPADVAQDIAELALEG